jgi:hypothetical protein
MRTKANWARIVVAVFTVAMLYSFACSTTCAVGICPNQTQQRPSHDCEPSGAHHSHHSNAPAPEKPDCSSHAHPTSLLVKSVEIANLQLVVSGHLSATSVLVSSSTRLLTNFTISAASDLAPPFGSSASLYQQISVLRI